MIRCRIIWVSLAATCSFLMILSTFLPIVHMQPIQQSAPSSSSHQETDFLTIDDLPRDGHLNSHASDSMKDLDCTCRQHAVSNQYNYYKKQKQQQQSSPSQPLKEARIFYLVILHNLFTLRDALPLFRALRGSNHIVVFHVDPKVQQLIDRANSSKTMNATELVLAQQLQEAWQQLEQELESCPCGSKVHVDSVHNVQWSRWSMNLPTLWGMQLAISREYWQQWDMFVNLSGDTLPVYTPQSMARILGALPPYNFVTARSCETNLVPTNVYDFPDHWHKRRHYTNDGRDEPPILHYNDTTVTSNGKVEVLEKEIQVEYYFGSQWVVLQPDFVHYVASALQRNDSFPSRYRDHLLEKNKVMTDETFLPTILMHIHPFNTTLPQVYTEEDTDDEEILGSIIYNSENNNHHREAHRNEFLPPIRTLRYERMDEHFPSPLRGYFPKHPRYEVPKPTTTDILIPPEPHVWGPYYLGVYDLADIKESGALFIRKTSSVLDPNLYHLLPVDEWQEIPPIQWPSIGVQASAVPNWPAEKERLMQKAFAKQQRQREEKEKAQKPQSNGMHDGEPEEEITVDHDTNGGNVDQATTAQNRLKRELMGTPPTTTWS